MAHRPAPHPEWVLMYPGGIPASTIAAGPGVPRSVVRYHLAVAARQDSSLRAAPRTTTAGQRNLEDVLALYRAEGRLPVSGRSRRESTLAMWLGRRRHDAATGALSPAYAAALDTIPGWQDGSAQDGRRPNT